MEETIVYLFTHNLAKPDLPRDYFKNDTRLPKTYIRQRWNLEAEELETMDELSLWQEDNKTQVKAEAKDFQFVKIPSFHHYQNSLSSPVVTSMDSREETSLKDVYHSLAITNSVRAHNTSWS